MSETIELLCWVIGTPTKQIFPVRVGQGDIWDGVKDAIKKEKKPEFDDIAADTLDLWKVIVSRSQRSSLESEDFLKSVMAKNPLDPIGPLSKDLNHPVPDDPINIIIVRRPTPLILPDIKGSIVNELELLHTHFWGQNRATFIQSSAAEIIDLSSVNYSRLNPLCIDVLLVRKEYHIAYDAIMAKTTLQVGRTVLLMTGQPGIGTTFFLLYFLFRQLQERKTVALQISANEFVVFDQSGVRLCSTAAVETFQIPKGIWTLSDSYGKLQLEPCIPFQSSRAHLLHTSSPSSSQWQEWVKQLRAGMYVMDIWSLEELRMLLTVSNLDSARGLTLFNQYGSNIRVIVDILNDPTQEVTYIHQVQVAAASIAHEFPAAFLGLLELDFSSKEVSSKIFTLRPENSISRNTIALTIETKFLLKTLSLALSLSAEAQKHEVFVMLNTHPTLRSPAGWMFENLAHVIVGDSKRSQLKIYDERNKEFSMPAPEEMISGNTALRGLRKPFRSFYWRPRETNYEGVDSVLRCGDNVWALQYTVSRSHRAATKGLADVCNTMNHISKVKWHLVMIGVTPSEAENARDSQKLTDPWGSTPIYACVVQLGAFDRIKFQQLQDVLDNDVVMDDC